MSMSFETHRLIQQLQIKPLDFIQSVSKISDHTLLQFLVDIYMDGDLTIFNHLFLFLGQELQKPGDLLIRVLDILMKYQDDIYFYVLDNLLPIILNFQVSTFNKYYHLSILHLSNYEPLLVKAIHFIDHSDNIYTLGYILKQNIQIQKALLRTINKYDPEFANFLYAIVSEEKVGENEEPPVKSEEPPVGNEEPMVGNEEPMVGNEEPLVGNEEPVVETSQPESVVFKLEDEELKSLEKIPPEMLQESMDLVDQALNDLQDFDNIPHLERQQKELDQQFELMESDNILVSNEPDINHDLLDQVRNEKIKNNKVPEVDNYQDFVSQISPEKLELLSAFIYLADKDSFLALAKNKKHKEKMVKPSCEKINKVLKNPVIFYNQLGTNHKKYKLRDFMSEIRKPKKPILYLDGMNALKCFQDPNQNDLCSSQNPYSDFFYPYQEGKFSIQKQIYNLDIWILLFMNLFYENRSDQSRLGSLNELYTVVIVVHEYLFQQILGECQKDHLNAFHKNGFVILGVGDKLCHELLVFYQLTKFYQEGDLLLTSQHYQWLNHGEGIAINGEYKFIEEYLPFVLDNVNSLTQALNKIFINYNFDVNLVDLKTIKKKKLSKKKMKVQKKKKRLSLKKKK